MVYYPQILPFIYAFLQQVFVNHPYGPDVVAGAENFELNTNTTDRILMQMELTLWHATLSEEGLSLFFKATFPQVAIISR